MKLTINRNTAQNGLELRFSNFPDRDLKRLLKDFRFQFSKMKGHWYASFSKQALAFAQSLKEVLENNREPNKMCYLPKYDATLENLEHKNYTFVIIVLKHIAETITEQWLVFDPFEKAARRIVWQYLNNKYDGNYERLSLYPRNYIQEARNLFKAGRILRGNINYESVKPDLINYNEPIITKGISIDSLKTTYNIAKIDDFVLRYLWDEFMVGSDFMDDSFRILTSHSQDGTILKDYKDLLDCATYDNIHCEFIAFEPDKNLYLTAQNSFPDVSFYNSDLEELFAIETEEYPFNKEFDAIINTVPYGKIEPKDYYVKEHSHHFKIKDYYQYYILRFLNMLKSHGKMYLVLPKKITSSITFQEFRKIVSLRAKVSIKHSFDIEDVSNGEALDILIFDKEELL